MWSRCKPFVVTSCASRYASRKSKLTRRQWIVLFYCWVRQYSVTDTVQENSAVQVHQYLRDICSWRLLNTDAPLMLGDQGVIAQIDESLFRHKPKVRSVVTFGAAPSWASHYSWVIVESVGQCYSHFTWLTTRMDHDWSRTSSRARTSASIGWVCRCRSPRLRRGPAPSRSIRAACILDEVRLHHDPSGS